MQIEQLAELDRLVKERYGVLVEEFAGYERETLPDFRDHRGVRLQKFVILLGPEVIGAFGMPAMNLEVRAEEITTAVIGAMRMLLLGASYGGGGSNATMCFLEGHEMPDVFWKVPLAQWATLREDERYRASVKVRHVFAVRHP